MKRTTSPYDMQVEHRRSYGNSCNLAGWVLERLDNDFEENNYIRNGYIRSGY